MEALAFWLTIAALLGTAVVGGIFLAFSTFVMQALGRIPTPHGVRAMQKINVTVVHPVFMAAFMGTTLVCLTLGPVAVVAWGQGWAPFGLAGSVVYVVGTFLVTGLGNVPLNNDLVDVRADDAGAEEPWRRYVLRWTRLNHVRTAAALVAAALHLAALLRLAGA